MFNAHSRRRGSSSKQHQPSRRRNPLKVFSDLLFEHKARRRRAP